MHFFEASLGAMRASKKSESVVSRFILRPLTTKFAVSLLASVNVCNVPGRVFVGRLVVCGISVNISSMM